MAVQWTKEQKQVIDLRHRNILVSAAAGSGKTAVLVERIITRLIKDNPPINIDELLVVTFTEAAAAEMKERVHAAIEKQLGLQPDNEHLQKQSTLVHNASITTIHSFCLSVIREHFHTIDLDPGFRIGEEGELKLLKQDVVKEVLELCFEAGENDFFSFVEYFATGKDDRKLEELILTIFQVSQSYEDPKKWLLQCAANYTFTSLEQYEQTKAIRLAKERCDCILSDAIGLIEQGLQVCQEDDGPYMYKPMLESDRQQVQAILKQETMSGRYCGLKELKWERLASNKDPLVSEQKGEFVKSLRATVKSYVEDIIKQYFFQTPEEMLGDTGACEKVVGTLASLVQQFSDAYSKKKREKNLIDFGDMERFALEILTNKGADGFVPSEAAKEYQQCFREIMIDEYQDSNLIQEAILNSVSTVHQGENNVFMVGDVKQSIYRFRLSKPELFMEKYYSYTTAESERQRIDLHKNFRSRQEVLDVSNFLFEQIMTGPFGGITYDENAALYVGAQYEPMEGNETELLLIHGDDILSLDLEDVDTEREAEARAIAGKIKELVGNHQVFDKDNQVYRTAMYKDIVILSRSMKGWSEAFSKVLGREGIPIYTGKGEGYFNTMEVSVVLQYLSVIDNLKQDIPLAAVMLSPLGGFNADELAVVKTEAEGACFYEAVFSYVQRGSDMELKIKIQVFVERIELYREQVPYTAIHHLLRRILKETQYQLYVSAMPGGEQRNANLNMLVEKAKAFGSTSYKGLFNFVRYIEQLKKYDIDYGEANTLDEQSDIVRMMSIHKSKGLEFPIVIVAGLSKQFNMQDGRSSVVIHPELGIGVEAVDMQKRTKSPTLLKRIIQKELAYESLAEELRVLYVALTRAKEKLIIAGTVTKLDTLLKGYETVKMQKSVPLSFSQLSKVNSYMQWIIAGFIRHKKFAEVLRHYDIQAPFTHSLYNRDIALKVTELCKEDIIEDGTLSQAEDQILLETLLAEAEAAAYSKEAKERLEKQFTYAYSYNQEQSMKLKFTVSELKKRMYMSEESGEVLYDDKREDAIIIPKFLQKEMKLEGAARGSAYHKFLELLDFKQSYTVEELIQELGVMQKKGKLSPEMAVCINPQDIIDFLCSPIGQRMQYAARQGKLKAEQPFVLGIKANDVYTHIDTDETLLVQGIIDVYFEEEDGLIVLDYKTDKVYDKQQLMEKYRIQLQYYAEALTRMTGKQVKEMWIYSFSIGEEIEINDGNS